LTITTVLLDLDDTLLDNPMSTFLPAYFAGLEKRLAKFVEDKNLRQLMSASVRAIQTNDDPNVTNEQAFFADFTQRIGHPYEALQPILNAFYREDYPHLRQYTTPHPEAKEIVKHLLDQGYKVIIATNPLFPATAIDQRLAWADVGNFPYALVTTLENSHFSKPDTRYYREILAKVESDPQTTLMVGDDPTNDIAPARQLGIKTWQVSPNSPEHSAALSNKYGPLTSFLAWLKEGGLLLLKA